MPKKNLIQTFIFKGNIKLLLDNDTLIQEKTFDSKTELKLIMKRWTRIFSGTEGVLTMHLIFDDS